LRGAGGTHEKPIRLDSIPVHIPPPRRSMELVYKSSQDRIQEMENVTKIICSAYFKAVRNSADYFITLSALHQSNDGQNGK
jgi:hypothetical protein